MAKRKLPPPRNRRGGWLALVVLGIDHHVTQGGFTVAVGAQVSEVTHGQMDDAAFARGHGRKCVWHAALADALSRNIGGKPQLLQTRGAEVLTVEADFLVFVRREPEHFQRYVLEGAQQFPAILQNEGAVRAGELHQDFRALPFAIAAQRRVNGDLVTQVKISGSNDPVQKFTDLLGGGDFIGNRHRRYLLAFLRARFSTSARISRPRLLRFITYC